MSDRARTVWRSVAAVVSTVVCCVLIGAAAAVTWRVLDSADDAAAAARAEDIEIAGTSTGALPDGGAPVTVHVIDGDDTTGDPPGSAAADLGSDDDFGTPRTTPVSEPLLDSDAGRPADDGSAAVPAPDPDCGSASAAAYDAISHAEQLLGGLPDDEAMMQLLVSSRERMLDDLRAVAHAWDDMVRWMRTVNSVCSPPVFTAAEIDVEAETAADMWATTARLADPARVPE